LRRRAAQVQDRLAEARDVHVHFDNDAHGRALTTAFSPIELRGHRAQDTDARAL